jgi:hydroxymethylpyrimidine pyrophosphatase-like HAD family hydrolase
MPIRLLVADVDGTLVTKSKKLTPRTRAAAARLRAAGVALVVTAGGRRAGSRRWWNRWS